MKKIMLLNAVIVLLIYCPGSIFAQQVRLPAISHSKIKVIVDERVELITIMQLLYDYPLVGKADINYKTDVLKYFAKHKDDASVGYFLDIAQRYLSFIKPI